ncbi:MAG: hypothetical protein ACJARS_003886 [bacterium]|jgi:hypothetical protein
MGRRSLQARPSHCLGCPRRPLERQPECPYLRIRHTRTMTMASTTNAQASQGIAGKHW